MYSFIIMCSFSVDERRLFGVVISKILLSMLEASCGNEKAMQVINCEEDILHCLFLYNIISFLKEQYFQRDECEGTYLQPELL